MNNPSSHSSILTLDCTFVQLLRYFQNKLLLDLTLEARLFYFASLTAVVDKFLKRSIIDEIRHPFSCFIFHPDLMILLHSFQGGRVHLLWLNIRRTNQLSWSIFIINYSIVEWSSDHVASISRSLNRVVQLMFNDSQVIHW